MRKLLYLAALALAESGDIQPVDGTSVAIGPTGATGG